MRANSGTGTTTQAVRAKLSVLKKQLVACDIFLKFTSQGVELFEKKKHWTRSS
jgi:hypothetical protein